MCNWKCGTNVPSGGNSTPANLEKSMMQHTYKEGDEFVFMDMETGKPVER